MGDSIRKAFQNVDEILSDNGYEANEENRRAVRALGYAEMEINEQAIDRVKEADQALRQVISRMNPAKTLEMIRNGDNPLDENIFELQNRLNSEGTPAQETEKYSKFLVRLERKGELTEDEKDAFIGMYRLFRQIEKSDGKLLGNVLNENGDLTLRNLLSASRSNRALAGGMDYTVDDDFGGLEKVIARGRSISEQIDGGFAKSALHQGSLRYNEQLAGEILEKLTPESLSINELSEDTTLSELYDRVESSYQNRSFSEEEVTADYEEDVALRKQAAEVEDSVIEALRNNRIPVTADNVLAENVLMNQRGSTFGRLMDQAAKARTTKDSSSAPEEGKNGNVNGKSMYDKLVEAFGDVIDNFDSYENAGEKYIEVLGAANALLNEESEEITDIIDIREAVLLHKELGVAARQAENENYEIPVEIDGRWTSINLKLVSDSEESGTVTATLETEGYGKIAAKFTVDNHRVSGFISGDDPQGLKRLSERADELSRELSGNGKEIGQLNFIDTKSRIFGNRRARREKNG